MTYVRSFPPRDVVAHLATNMPLIGVGQPSLHLRLCVCVRLRIRLSNQSVEICFGHPQASYRTFRLESATAASPGQVTETDQTE